MKKTLSDGHAGAAVDDDGDDGGGFVADGVADRFGSDSGGSVGYAVGHSCCSCSVA